MNNTSEGIIEGNTVNTGLSDLSPLQTFSERFDARLHGAGINDEENAGQRNNIGATVLVTPRSGDSKAYWPVSALSNTAPHCYRNLNPCAEEGMHTRSQQIFSSRSRMGNREPDAHARDAAVAQRLHSDTFGGGETRHENAEALKIGGSIELRHPASNLL
jgi:hypothetical protein